VQEKDNIITLMKNINRTTWSQDVLDRFMTDEELRSLDERYREHLRRRAGGITLGREDYKNFIDWVNGDTTFKEQKDLGNSQTRFLRRCAEIGKKLATGEVEIDLKKKTYKLVK